MRFALKLASFFLACLVAGLIIGDCAGRSRARLDRERLDDCEAAGNAPAACHRWVFGS